jgi:hypothetical protein
VIFAPSFGGGRGANGRRRFELNIQSDRAHAADWRSTSEGVPRPLLEIASSLEAKLSSAIF